MSDKPVLDYAMPERQETELATRFPPASGRPESFSETRPDPRRYRRSLPPGPIEVGLFVALVVLAVAVLVVGIAAKIIWTQVLHR